MPKVSLIAPVYGVENYINQFLESIRKQTFHDFEVILVDDGSKDNCPRILDDFAQENKRYHVIHQSNSGVSIARNVGIEKAAGDYIYIVDSDDWLEPSALEDLWNEKLKNDADLVYGDYILEYTDKIVEKKYCENEFYTTDRETIQALQFAVNANSKSLKISRPEFEQINTFGGAPWRCMIRTSIIKDNDIRFDPYVRGLGDDILFMLHVYEYVKSVSYIHKVIYHYRKLEDSYAHGYKANYLEIIGKIREKQEDFLRKYDKENFFWQSYAMRMLLYIQEGMKRYFLNENNPKSEMELRDECLNLIGSDSYKSIWKNLPIKIFAGRKMKISAYLLRRKLYGMYWRFSKRGLLG